MRILSLIISITLLSGYLLNVENLLDSSNGLSDKEQFVIYIKSANSQDTVFFDGGYLFFHEQDLGEIEILESEKTPFTIINSSDGFAGTFKSNSANDELFIIVAKRKGDFEEIIIQKKGREVKVTEYDSSS